MKKLVLLMTLLIMTFTAFAAELTIGSGTIGERYPLGNYFGYDYSAALYRASEIGAHNIQISALSWYSHLATNVTVPTKIYLKTSSASNLANGTWADMLTGATLVYNQNQTGLIANGWNQFTLSPSFDVDMGENLIILVERRYGGYGIGGAWGAEIYSSAVSNTHLSWSNSGTPPSGTGFIRANRPNVKLGYTDTDAISVFPWQEGFEGATFPPTDWSTVNADGDSYDWFLFDDILSAHSGEHCAASASYDEAALTPDNWLITALIALPSTSECIVEYYVSAFHAIWFQEHYAFYISTTGTDPADFTLLREETLEDADWHYRGFNLASYAGQNVYFAFRHFDCEDVYDLKIDDVTVRELPAYSILSYAPAAWDFGNAHPLTANAPKEFLLTNTGSGTINITSSSFSLHDPEGNFVLSTDNLPAALSPINSYNFSIGFIPQSLGNKTATLSIQDNFTRIVHSIQLSGQAVIEPVMSILSLSGEARPPNNAFLSWTAIYGQPSEPGFLHYDDGIPRIFIGQQNISYNVAVKFGTESMSANAGMELTNVMIHIAAEPGSVDILKVWSGTDADLAPTTLLHQQTLSGLSLGWNNILLSSPVAISGSEAIYVGYYINDNTPYYYFPAATDGLRAVDGRGNFLVINNQWNTANAYGLSGSWLIHAYFADARSVDKGPAPMQPIPVKIQELASGTPQHPPFAVHSRVETERSLRGFNIYRDNNMVNASPGPLYYYWDEDVPAGNHLYSVQAVHYNDNGPLSNAITVTVPAWPEPITLPFSEAWASGDFASNHWSAQDGNWYTIASDGNQPPCAIYAWRQVLQDYSSALSSYYFDATGMNNVELSFDIRLDNGLQSLENTLTWQAWDGSAWQDLGSYSSLDGSLNWTNYSLDISEDAAERNFRIRFVANGENNDGIAWYLDNISISASCTAVTNLSIESAGSNINLSWNPVPEATWYYIYASTDPQGPFAPHTWTVSTSITIPKANLLGNKYFFRVTANDGLTPPIQRKGGAH